MKVTLQVNYTQEEINQIIATLQLLSTIIDNESPSTLGMTHYASKAFENLAQLLCLDPKGEYAFNDNGW